MGSMLTTNPGPFRPSPELTMNALCSLSIAGFEKPTPVQRRAILPITQGRNAIVQARGMPTVSSA